MEPDDECSWGSRPLFLMVLLSLTNGTSIFTKLVTVAIANGAAGYVIGYVIIFLLMGIPMLYMEFIISQFTTRNCIEVWKVRSCLSHLGYIQISWQIFFIIYNHTLTSFVIHYFLISFEDPIPYHICGHWAKQNCNIASTNFTVNEDCIKLKTIPFAYCEKMHTTYPEIQYWIYFILGNDKEYYYIAWRVCLASGIACTITYLSCFKRKQSMKWFIWLFTFYPTVGYFLLMVGSMMQKGLVEKFEEGFDTSFRIFVRKYRITDIIHNVIFTLNIGSGIAFNLGASTSFRAPCYSNVVVTVVVCTAFVVLVVCTNTMMTCPYVYHYNTKSYVIMDLRITHVFEKTPRLLKEFNEKALWLILSFSSNAILGLSSNSMVILSLLETFAAKHTMVHRYNGLFTFAISVSLFLITIPLLGSRGVNGVFDFSRYIRPILMFMGIVENLVFVVWYGVDKFSEDVHFMQGIQPTAYMKLMWMISSLIMGYVFVSQVYLAFYDQSQGMSPGRCAIIIYLILIVMIPIVKLLVAACNKKFLEAIKLDPMWGPRSEVLMRSRAMFSAQAMTKEYMYRQYHLQAGITARQRTANVRRNNREHSSPSTGRPQ